MIYKVRYINSLLQDPDCKKREVKDRLLYKI